MSTHAQPRQFWQNLGSPSGHHPQPQQLWQTLGSPSGHSPTSHSNSGKPWLRLLSPGLPHHPQTPARLLDLPPIPLRKGLPLHGNRSLHAWEARWHGSVPGPAPQSLASVPEVKSRPYRECTFPVGPCGLGGPHVRPLRGQPLSPPVRAP